MIQRMLKISCLRIWWLVLCGALLSACEVGDPQSSGESVEISDHYLWGSDEVVIGATILIRDFDAETVRASVSTKALEADHAYSLWWAVYNYPEYCRVPHQCDCEDLELVGGDPRIKVSVFWAGGFTADDNGSAETSLQLRPGKTTRPILGQSKDYGLVNLEGAEIHLILRTHGLAGMWGTVAEQISKLKQACPPEQCTNVFRSFHPPRS
ncbi:MAG: hypothetical protein AAF438_07475 [Pseudomonadota bacterium]